MSPNFEVYLVKSRRRPAILRLTLRIPFSPSFSAHLLHIPGKATTLLPAIGVAKNSASWLDHARLVYTGILLMSPYERASSRSIVTCRT